jgi:hypothetical protein
MAMPANTSNVITQTDAAVSSNLRTSQTAMWFLSETQFNAKRSDRSGHHFTSVARAP